MCKVLRVDFRICSKCSIRVSYYSLLHEQLFFVLFFFSVKLSLIFFFFAFSDLVSLS